MHRLKIWFTRWVILPLLILYQRPLGRFMEARRRKLQQRFFDFYTGEEPDYEGAEYQSLLQSSQRMDRLSLYELRLEHKITALDTRITPQMAAQDRPAEAREPGAAETGEGP